MTTLEEYGPLFRAAYGALHGGHPDEPRRAGEARQPQESAADFLARSRVESLERLQRQLAAVRPPRRLRNVHDALARLLAAASEADREMALQVEAYARGETEASLRHSERVASLVAESVRLDRDLILALQAAEEARSGTLVALGLADIVPPT
ncbi:MAG: hypothetical protein ACE5KW_03365 [Dehalococcoidia bacterium]